MKKTMLFLSIPLACVIITASRGNTQLKPNAIDCVKPLSSDIPEGFMYGTIPPPYRATLKDNPWMMDRAAIKRLADKIYPGGDYTKISGMHVSIIAEKGKPYGDDIVCYVILFNGMKAAHDQIKKMTEFAGFNRDRVLLLTRDNLAVIMFVDNFENFHYIQDLAERISGRMKDL